MIDRTAVAPREGAFVPLTAVLTAEYNPVRAHTRRTARRFRQPPSMPPAHASRQQGASLLRRVRRRRAGVAAVELAILLPLLVYLFVIVLDWSRILYYSVVVNNCARNGAMYASDPYSGTLSPYGNVTQAAQADAPNLSPSPAVTTASGTDADGYSYVDCTVTYNFQTVTNFPGVPKTTAIVRTVRVYPAAQVPK